MQGDTQAFLSSYVARLLLSGSQNQDQPVEGPNSQENASSLLSDIGKDIVREERVRKALEPIEAERALIEQSRRGWAIQASENQKDQDAEFEIVCEKEKLEKMKRGESTGSWNCKSKR
jgi:hypothetical protein